MARGLKARPIVAGAGCMDRAFSPWRFFVRSWGCAPGWDRLRLWRTSRPDLRYTLLGGEAEWLASRIVRFELSSASLQSELSSPAQTPRAHAFQTILRNRTAHGGILAEGAGVIKTGEGGRGLASRWYPTTLARRIRDIAHIADRLTFVQGDAFAALTQYRDDPNAVFFIDPPYTAGGKRAGSRLYAHSEIDHEALFRECKRLAGDFLMTYDNAPEVAALAHRHGFATRAIAMKNTHHAEMSELLIGRNLDWVI